MKKLEQPDIRDVLKKLPQMQDKMEKVELPKKPDLSPVVSFIERLWLWINGTIQKQGTDLLAGKDVESLIPKLPTTIQLIIVAVILVLAVVLFWLAK